MHKFSFRIKIMGTIIIVVSLFSLISFTVFNYFLKDKLLSYTEETFSHINLLRDQYYYTISLHDGRIIRSMLKNTEMDKDVLKTYLVNPESKVVYPHRYAELGSDTMRFSKLYNQKKDISIKSYNGAETPFYRVFIRLQNSPSCVACHAPSQINLGMIIMDLSSNQTQKIIKFSRRFSFYYTFFILLSIFLLVAYLHYRYIRKSLKQFRDTIMQINHGHLDMRLEIPEVRELSRLGNDFNEMLDTFEKTQIELQNYHQKELQNSQKLATIGEMSARIAHEIRNPVTGIARAMEIIIAELKDSDHKPILEEIQRQANRVNQAISNMLKFSRSKDLVLQTGDINELIQSLVFFLRNQANEKVIKFDLMLQKDLPVLTFDHELVENVLLNLSFNAIQAIPENGTVNYATIYDSTLKVIVISVKDNGSGIPEAISGEIYKPFYTTRTKGTGLGLAISKDIIERHKGELWHENNPVSGCTFFIRLPV